MNEVKKISVVIPVYNEEESLPALHQRLMEELPKAGVDFEIIFSDDGSRDGSLGLLRKYAEDHRIKVISLRRNFGQTAAMDAGFRHASGDVVIPMDADLQNDPADIPMLLEHIRDGYDVVKGWRKDRKDTLISRKLPSRIANWLISWVTGVRLHDYGCTLTAYRKDVLETVRLYGEMHRFIPAYAVNAGGKMKEVVVRHHARQFGETKYNITRTFRVILDLMTVRFLLGYATKPLYLFGKFGLSLGFLAFCSFLWSFTKKLVWTEPFFTDPFFYLTIFLFLAALQILLIGLVAELNVRTYFESQGKPPYVVKETHNLEEG
jgi:glycosyltransferase involved in cell wall biosynthesis